MQEASPLKHEHRLRMALQPQAAQGRYGEQKATAFCLAIRCVSHLAEKSVSGWALPQGSVPTFKRPGYGCLSGCRG